MVKDKVEINIKKYLGVLRSKDIKVNKAILYGSYAVGAADRDQKNVKLRQSLQLPLSERVPEISNMGKAQPAEVISKHDVTAP